VVGPSMGDFASTVGPLRDAGGVVATDARRLADTLRDLLGDPARQHEIAAAGRAVIASRQGASARAATVLLERCRVDLEAPA